jgi:GH43 family beta-xylosidase
LNITNPILPLADPFVARHAGMYYVTGTHDATSLEMWAAPSLASLRNARPVTIWTPDSNEPAHHIWSPTLFLLPYRGALHWFLYFTASVDDTNAGHRIFVLEGQGPNPLGPYTFRGQPAGMADATTIDPSLLFLHGRYFLLYVDEPGDGPEPDANVIRIAPMSDPLTLAAPGRPIAYPDLSWECGYGAGQSTYPVAEGPTALYHGGQIFIVYSAAHTGNYNYCLGLLTYDGAGDPTDRRSWTKTGPVFTHSEAHHVYGPGRACFTTSLDDREDWMLYHAKDTPAFTTEGRTTRAQRFAWHPDGTPDFGTPVALKAPGSPRGASPDRIKQGDRPK